IGIAGNDLDIKATGTLTSSSYGNANIIQTDGDLSLNTVATVSGTAYISAPAGRILNGASSGYNIASGKTYLFAQNDIGTSANPITTQVGFLEGLSTLGAAYITNTGSMTIGGVTGSPTGFDTAGPLVISAMSPITIETSVSSGDDITITASDDDPGDVNSIVVEDGVTISSKKNVTLDAGDNITIMKGAEIDAGTTNAPGTIFMYAANHANLGSNYNYGAVVELYGTLTASSVDIFGGVYGNTFVITNIQAGTPFNIQSGGGNDSINVGSNATPVSNSGGTLAAIDDLLTIDGQGGSCILSLDDTGDTAGQLGTITASTITGFGIGGSISYSDIGTLNINLGSGNNIVNVQSTSAAIGTNIVTGAGNDSVYVSSSANVDPISGTAGFLTTLMNGTLAGIDGRLNIDEGAGENLL